MGRRAVEREHVADDPPLLAGQIHGLRRWSLGLKDGGIRLGSAYTNFWWEPGGVPTLATCGEGSLRRRHRPPGKRCGCGLYALHPGRDSASEVFPVEHSHGLPSEVSGLVEAWGQVEVHETGFRAQFAHPVALILHRDQSGTEWGELVGRIARAYGAEVLLVKTANEVAEYCRERGLGLSRDTVARLVPKEQESFVSEPAVGRKPRRWTLGDLAGGAMAVVVGLVVAAFWLMVWGGMALAILGAIFGWFGDDSRSATTIARGHLKVVDQAVLGRASREPIYVAVVRNDDRRRAALGVAPRLRVDGVDGSDAVAELANSGRFDRPANVPPGGTAVAFDHLPVVPSGTLREPRFRVAAFRRVPRFPIERVTARLDRNDCRLTAEVTASRRLQDLRLVGLARQGRRIVGGGTFRIASVPAGRSRHRLPRVAKRSCGPSVTRWSLHAALAPPHGRWR